MSPHVEEAARLARALAARRSLRTITAPLTAAGVLAGAALVFLTAVKELPATLILAPIEFDTLATEIWSATTIGFFERGAVPSLVLLAISAALPLPAPGPRMRSTRERLRIEVRQLPPVKIRGQMETESTAAGISVRGLAKHFGRVAAVDGLDLEAQDGQITALLGPAAAARRPPCD